MKVYHGSSVAIEEIDLNYCEVGKDFGKGFYVTKLYEQAETWAKRKGKKTQDVGVVTEFDFDEFFFENDMIKFLHFEDYNETWLDFIVLNRRNKTKYQAHDYDIIEGPVADDQINRQIDDYLNGTISKEQFLNELIHTPSHQICFCTVQSLQALTLYKGKIDSAIYHIDDYVVQALMIDYEKTEIEAMDIYYTSETYSELAAEITELYKKTWQEIYEILKTELKHENK